jgi:hypothetical protein
MAALAAVVALIGAGCMAAGTPGDNANAEPAVGSVQEASVVGELPSAPPPPPGSLTFSCAGFWNGVWCGGNQGFPGSTDALYYCYEGNGTLIIGCPGPCQAEPSGVEDHC